jgi:hypothetical protein
MLREYVSGMRRGPIEVGTPDYSPDRRSSTGKSHHEPFIRGDVDPNHDPSVEISSLPDGTEYPIASGKMSFGRDYYDNPYVLQNSHEEQGDPWEFVGISQGPRDPVRYGVRLPNQANPDTSLDEAPEWKRNDNTTANKRMAAAYYIQWLLNNSKFDSKTGLATLSLEDSAALRKYLDGLTAPYGDRVQKFQAAKGENGSKIITFPNASDQQAFPYGRVDANGYKPTTQGQIVIPKSRSAPITLYDLARDPSAFVHYGADGKVGIVDSTGGHQAIHGRYDLHGVTPRLTGNIGGARPAIMIHPDAVIHRDDLARQIASGAVSPAERGVVSHRGTGVPILDPPKLSVQGMLDEILRRYPASTTPRPQPSIDALGPNPSPPRTPEPPNWDVISYRGRDRMRRSLRPSPYLFLRKSNNDLF